MSMSERASSALPQPLLPPAALAALLACVAGAAALANCAVLAALIRRSRNGLFSYLIQLALSDLTLIGIISLELWSTNERNWYFGSTVCSAYQGLSVFCSTLSLYILVGIALHVIATVNLEEKAADRRFRRNAKDEEDEIRSSQHSLMPNSVSSTPPRTMNVDYRLVDTQVSSTLPTICVWVIAMSQSLPEFTLSSTVRFENKTICTLDSNHRFNMHSMLTVFNIIVPLFVITVVSVLILRKIQSKTKAISVEMENIESRAGLKLTVWLIIVYVVFCAPRVITCAGQALYAPIEQNSQTLHIWAIINLSSSFLTLVSTMLRPMLCITVSPRLKNIFSVGYRFSDTVY